MREEISRTTWERRTYKNKFKGALDKYNIIGGYSSPNFFPKSWDFDTIRSVGFWLFACFFTFEEIWIFLAFSIVQSLLQ